MLDIKGFELVIESVEVIVGGGGLLVPVSAGESLIHSFLRAFHELVYNTHLLVSVGTVEGQLGTGVLVHIVDLGSGERISFLEIEHGV